METFADRLQDALDKHHEKPSQADLARAAGIKSSSMAGWMTGNTSAANVKAQPLIQAAAFLRVRPQWLLDGRGSRNVHSSSSGSVREPEVAWDAWPFHSIKRSRFDRLQERYKGIVEGYLRRLIDEAEELGKVRTA
jgi:transcriptional regulator with XRE-family HTH domain